MTTSTENIPVNAKPKRQRKPLPPPKVSRPQIIEMLRIEREKGVKLL